MRKTFIVATMAAGLLGSMSAAYAHDPVTGAVRGAGEVAGAAVGAAVGVTTGAAIAADEIVTGRPYRYHRHRHCWINRFGEQRCRWR